MFDIVRAYCNYDNSVGYNKYFITFAQFLYEQLNPSKYNKEIAFIHIPDDEDLQDSSVFWMMIHIFIKLDYRSILINQYAFTVSEKFLNTLTPSVKSHLSVRKIVYNSVSNAQSINYLNYLYYYCFINFYQKKIFLNYLMYF